MIDTFTEDTVRRVGTLLAGVERLGVAFSGGVDSSVLLALAARALGRDRVVAILGVSPSLAADHRLDAVAYGENADDARRPDRPGSRAAAAHRVLRPLVDAGLDKSAVRDIARALDLPCADKPAAPCLASRIPHFEVVSPEKLRQVERAEAALRRLGFGDLRVRHHGDVARIELTADDLVRAVTDPLRRAVQAAVIDAGFRFVAVDLAGLQSGAFTLPLVEAAHG